MKITTISASSTVIALLAPLALETLAFVPRVRLTGHPPSVLTSDIDINPRSHKDAYRQLFLHNSTADGGTSTATETVESTERRDTTRINNDLVDQLDQIYGKQHTAEEIFLTEEEEAPCEGLTDFKAFYDCVVKHRGKSLTAKALPYETIQQNIEVSRPYYSLHDEAEITDSKTGENIAFVANVRPDMPHSYESGVLTAAEAGRHTAIAGSMAASLHKPTLGKFSYSHLAMDAVLRREPKKLGQGFEYLLPDREGHCKLIAFNTQMSQQDATCEVYLITPDGTMWHSTLTYKVIPHKALDEKRICSTDSSLVDDSWDPATYQYRKELAPITTVSAPGAMLHQSVAKLPPVTPALLVAYLCSHLVHMGAQSVAELAGVQLLDLHDNPNSVTVEELTLNAQTLGLQGTSGLDVSCATTVHLSECEGFGFTCDHSESFTSHIIVTSDDEEKVPVANLKVTYSLNESEDDAMYDNPLRP